MSAAPSTFLPIRWVQLERYCELTGDSPMAVHKRRQVGKWLDGVHCRVRDRRVWVNLEAAQKWVEGEAA
jgi:hypothetical protein